MVAKDAAEKTVPNAPDGKRSEKPRARKSPRLRAARSLFLDALREGMSITAAACAAGVARTTVYNWRTADPDFADLWVQAEEAGTDRLEDAAVERAVLGREKAIIHRGEIVGHVHEPSDTLLAMLLKSRRPEKFGSGAAEDNAEDFGDIKDALHRKFAAILTEDEAAELPEIPDRS